MTDTGNGVTELLATADTSWTTAAGVWRHWHRRDLVRRAFDQYFDRRSADGQVTWSVELPAPEPEDVEPEQVAEQVRAVVIQRSPRRIRSELLSSRGQEPTSDLLVVDGDLFWARYGSEIRDNAADRTHRHGADTEFSTLLEPAYVPAAFRLASAGAGTVAGRPTARVTAVAQHNTAEWERLTVLPFGMVFGGDEFVLDVDSSAGVVLRAVKLVDGKPAEIQEWVELTLDAPAPRALFAPLF